MDVTIKIGGLSELGEALRNMGDDMVLKTARRMGNAAAQLVKKEAIDNARESRKSHQLGVRKDQIVQPGNLKKNIIVVRLKPFKLGREDYTVGVRHGSGIAGKDAFYWVFLEFGTVKFEKDPFLRPAFDNNTIKAINTMRVKGWEDIERSARKHRKQGAKR